MERGCAPSASGARDLRAVAVTSAAVLAVGGVLVACGSGTGHGAPTSASGSAQGLVAPSSTEEFRPGLDADIYTPTTTGPATTPATVTPGGSVSRTPVVVLIPGGGWTSADRSGLAPLAAALARSGMTVVSATYRTADSGTFYPAPLEDVACAVAFAAARATAAGIDPHPLVVVGHSAGANLAALAALTPEHVAATCPYPAVAPDALVGLSGPYDVAEIPEIAVALFGVSAQKDAALWKDGNPLTHADSRPDVPVLLLHGRADPVVPVSFTTRFAVALKDGGHQVTVELVAGADHVGTYQADVAAPRLVDWIDNLP